MMNNTTAEMKETAYEWHNESTGHCYVDYVPHNLMDENNGYVKTPLYKEDKILAITGHGLSEAIDSEVGRKLASEVERVIEERMPKKRSANATAYNDGYTQGYADALRDVNK